MKEVMFSPSIMETVCWRREATRSSSFCWLCAKSWRLTLIAFSFAEWETKQ